MLWTLKVQKEKEEKMELIVHQPGKTMQFLTENDLYGSWPSQGLLIFVLNSSHNLDFEITEKMDGGIPLLRSF